MLEANSTFGPGLPDGLFQTKNPNVGTFLRALEWKMFLYFMIIWNILWPFSIMKWMPVGLGRHNTGTQEL
jgi:hypothetical protein